MSHSSALAPAVLFLCATTAPRRYGADDLALLCACSPAETEAALRELHRQRLLVRDRDERGEVWGWVDSPEARRRAPALAAEACSTPFLEYCLGLREGRILDAADGLVTWVESQARQTRIFAVAHGEIVRTLLHAPVRDHGDRDRARFIELCLRVHALADFSGRDVRVLLLRARGVARMLDNAGYLYILNTILNVRRILLDNRRPDRSGDESALPPGAARGDTHLLAEAVPYLGMYKYLQGNARQALDHFFLAGRPIPREAGGGDAKNAVSHGAFSTSFAALAAVQCGDWSLGASLLRAALRGARNTGCPTRSWLHTHLATVLLAAGRPDEALEDVDAALAVGLGQNVQCWMAARIALAHYHIAAGRPDAAHAVLRRAVNRAAEHGYRWGYSSPWFLDMLHVFWRYGLPSLEGYALEDELTACLKGPNPLLKAVAERIRGDLLFRRGAPPGEALLPLLKSRAFFKIQQLPVEKCKSCALLAQVYLYGGDRARALRYAIEARPRHEQFRRLGIYWSPELAALLPDIQPERGPGGDDPAESLRDIFVKSLLTLNPEDREFFLQDLVRGVARALGADRACLFDADAAGRPRLVKSLHLGPEQVFGKNGRFPLYLVKESLEDVPVCATRENSGLPPDSDVRDMVCCIPIPAGPGRPHVLYLDGDGFPRPEEMDENFLLACGEFLGILLNRWLAAAARPESRPLSLAGPDPARAPLICQSEAMRRVLDLADGAAPTVASVLLYGESGVGKELVARRIHDKSGRNGAFVALNLSSLPEELFESEMLGYERGAFTGAQQRKAGLLEMAHQGTLFIDEVPDISPRIQVKLLRLLQERTFIRLGGTRVIASDFRLLVATNRNLFDEVRRGGFRHDLFYRICVVPLSIPPLRERPEDLDALIRHYLEHFSRLHGKALVMPTPGEWATLRAYAWPGNIRELKNVLERAVIFGREGRLAVSFDAEGFGGPLSAPAASLAGVDTERDAPPAAVPTLRDMEKQHIQDVLRLTGGKVAGPDGAAALLGMSRSTLYDKMRSLGVTSPGKTTPPTP